MPVPELLDYPPTLPNVLRHGVERFGDQELVVTADDRRFTYAEIDQQSCRLARRLLAAGVGKGTRVAILFPQSPEWLIAYFAVGRVGAVAVPLSTFAKPPELLKVLRHADVDTLLVAPTILGIDQVDRLREALPRLRGAGSWTGLRLTEAPFLRSIQVMGDDGGELVSEELLAEVESEVTPADALAVVYTSGTSSEPKGVVHTHGALVRHGENLRRLTAVVEGDRVFAAMPLFWVGGISLTLGPTLHAGATLLLQERFAPAEALALMARERATVATGWATVISQLVEHPDFASTDLSRMRIPLGSRRGGLGMTETCGQHSWKRLDDDPVPPIPGALGRSVDGVEHRIADPSTNATLPAGTVGEICVRGYSVTVGMVKRERHEVFDSDGWYHTGDEGWLTDEGIMVFTGRLSEMVKTKGNNVAPAEVEAALLQHPAVWMANVFGVPDADVDEAVAAVVVLRDAIDPAELQAWLKERVASYKVPTRMLVMTEDEVPMLPTGKPDKRAMAATVARVTNQPEPEPAR